MVQQWGKLGLGKAPTTSPVVGSTAAKSASLSRRLDEHGQNLLELAKSQSDFAILVEAVEKAGLADSLAKDELTIMAPNDEAFEKCFGILGIGKDMAFADANMLAQILSYHAVPGKVMSADVKDGMEVTTA